MEALELMDEVLPIPRSLKKRGLRSISVKKGDNDQTWSDQHLSALSIEHAAT